MSTDDASYANRRAFLKLSATFIAGGVCCGFLEEMGKDAYGYVKGLTPGAAGRVPGSELADLLFAGNPSKTAVVPPGTNRHLVAKGRFNPSRYVASAYSASTGAQKSLVGVTTNVALDSTNPALNLAAHRNLLILGGPVATELTRCLFGYTDVPSVSDGKLVPVPIRGWPLPFYFHVGNRLGYGRWGNELRTGLRLLEDGKEEALPLYGVRLGAAGPIIPPPLLGKRVVGDMLMITRVPNPRHRKGAVTMIGGLHGYSLESFFSDAITSAKLVATLTDGFKHDYFQALLPYQMDSSGRATLNLESTSPWHIRVAPVDGERYLSRFATPRG